MEIRKWRIWCLECQEWEVHKYNKIQSEDKWVCEKCGRIFTGYFINELPPDKKEEQIDRYKKVKSQRSINRINGILNSVSNSYIPMGSSFFNDSVSVIIDEDDVNYEKHKKTDEQNRLKKLKEYIVEMGSIKGQQRNQKCKCGSGQKYKRCCKNKYDQMKQYVDRYDYLLYEEKYKL